MYDVHTNITNTVDFVLSDCSIENEKWFVNKTNFEWEKNHDIFTETDVKFVVYSCILIPSVCPTFLKMHLLQFKLQHSDF